MADQVENFKEERPLQPIRKIVVKSSVDVVFRRSDKPSLVVGGETEQAMKSVDTRYKGDKLVIESVGATLSGQGNVNINGGVTINRGSFLGNYVGGSVTIGRNYGSVTVNGSNIVTGIGRAIVWITLPEAPNIGVQGSGNVTLIDVDQQVIEIEIEGSGDITIDGQVAHLDVEISGSGEVNAKQLVTETANFEISGSGEIKAFVRSEVVARVAGSGDIVIHGNPISRDTKIAGSGEIKFR